MINLDQVRTLEWKVKQAVQLIVQMRRENDTLRGRLSDTEVRLQELETLLETFKATQNEMESGIRSALEDLEHLEDAAPASSSLGSVDPVSYPPAASEPVPSPAPVSEPEVEASGGVDADRTFEEEFAALAAEEAAQAAVPESVELEEVSHAGEEESLYEESAPEAETTEERGPEQPGLGIF